MAIPTWWITALTSTWPMVESASNAAMNMTLPVGYATDAGYGGVTFAKHTTPAVAVLACTIAKSAIADTAMEMELMRAEVPTQLA